MKTGPLPIEDAKPPGMTPAEALSEISKLLSLANRRHLKPAFDVLKPMTGSTEDFTLDLRNCRARLPQKESLERYQSRIGYAVEFRASGRLDHLSAVDAAKVVYLSPSSLQVMVSQQVFLCRTAPNPDLSMNDDCVTIWRIKPDGSPGNERTRTHPVARQYYSAAQLAEAT